MPKKITVVDDQNNLVPTSSFPHAKWKFDKFNPVQSRVFEFYDQDCNSVVAACTASGKTTVAEIVLSHEIRNMGGKGIYLAPLKALAQEKIDDWTDKEHHFSDLKISICTGDYRLTADKKKELEEANLVLLTSEMLNSKSRSFKSETNTWLKGRYVVIVDESHLLTMSGRGDHLEAGLMKFTELNPDCRLVLLSATMPNVKEIAEWVSTLNNKPTYLLESKYRPCPLTIHFDKYYDGDRRYDETEIQKVNSALEVVEYYDNDKFIIFAHTKKTGELMKNALIKAGIECEFHNADLDKAKRLKVEKKFKEDPNFRVIVATSTLAVGINMPARRVVILGVHRGMSEVPTYEIIQEIGRAGRPAFDPMGDAYVLLPETPEKFNQHKERLKKPQPIISQMLDDIGGHHKVLAFHIVSEMHQGNIKTKEDIHHWYKRSLAAFQSQELEEDIVDNTIELLMMCGAVWLNEDKSFSVTTIGKIASMFYFSPFDIADLKRNFTKLFTENKQDNDLALAMALGDLDTYRCGIVSKAEREEMSHFVTAVQNLYGSTTFLEPALKAGFVYYNCMHGLMNPLLAATQRGVQLDYPRTSQILEMIDSMSCKWDKQAWFRQLQLRVAYGVQGEMAYLCQLPHIGKVRAQKLWDNNVKTIDDVVNTETAVLRKMLNLKVDLIEEITTKARQLKFGV